jgi:hypothetical protein
MTGSDKSSIRTATDNHILNMIKMNTNYKKVKEYVPIPVGDREFEMEMEELPEELDNKMDSIRLNNYNLKPKTYIMKPKGITKLNIEAKKTVKITMKKSKSAEKIMSHPKMLKFNRDILKSNRENMVKNLKPVNWMRNSVNSTLKGIKELIETRNNSASRSRVSNETSKSQMESNLSRL